MDLKNHKGDSKRVEMSKGIEFLCCKGIERVERFFVRRHKIGLHIFSVHWRRVYHKLFHGVDKIDQREVEQALRYAGLVGS